jgi:hypothetical protein
MRYRTDVPCGCAGIVPDQRFQYPVRESQVTSEISIGILIDDV